jgi:hypothetical protein
MGKKGGDCCKNDGRRGVAAAMRDGAGRLGFLRRGGSDAPDALDAKLTAHNQIPYPYTEDQLLVNNFFGILHSNSGQEATTKRRS